MYVVEITIRHYPGDSVHGGEPERPPTSTWTDRTGWPDSFDGWRRTPAGVLNDAVRRMTTEVLPTRDPNGRDL